MCDTVDENQLESSSLIIIVGDYWGDGFEKLVYSLIQREEFSVESFALVSRTI